MRLSSLLRALSATTVACCALAAQAGDIRQGAEPFKYVPAPYSAQAAPKAVGGPDAAGYSFIDSSEPGAPAFDWMDISTTGNALPLGDDEHVFPIALPFTFSFYGTDYTQLAVGSNGVVYFEDVYLGLSNSPIPGPTAYAPVQTFIAGYWDDLYTPGGGAVFEQTLGEAPGRVHVVQWQEVSHCCSGGLDSVTFQVVLYEGSNDIRIQYLDPSPEAGASAGIGIQGSDTVGLQYSNDVASLSAGLAICFVAPGSSHPCTVQQADLWVQKSVGNSTALIGDTVVYSIIVGNDGPLDAANVRVLDLPPERLDPATVVWACINPSGTACPDPDSDTGGIDATLATLPSGATVGFAMFGRVALAAAAEDDFTAFDNTASVLLPPDAVLADPADNNQATASVLVVPLTLFADGFETPPPP